MKTINKITISILLIFAAFSVWLGTEIIRPHTCSIFTAQQGDTVLFGDNFDYHEGELIIGFFPPTAGSYGRIYFGYAQGEDHSYQRAINDHGLAWAVNSVPRTTLTPHPERLYSHAEDNFVSTISRRADSVEEAIQIAHFFDFGDAMEFQIHIADASGDAVVIGPGPDGEIAFTRKAVGDGYLFSTNFSLATPARGPVDFRWDTGNAMLETLDTTQALTPAFAGDVLAALHLKTLTTHTLLSNVIDLPNGEIYIYYMSQYGEAARFNIDEELAKGQRVIEVRSLFSAETAAAGDASYQAFETRFFTAIAGVLVLGAALVIGVIALLARVFRRRKAAQAAPVAPEVLSDWRISNV